MQIVKSLIVDLSRRYGGASTRAITLSKGLKDWKCAIAALDGSPVSKAAAEAGVPVITMGRSRIDPRLPLRIATAVQEGHFDLVDTQNIQSKVWGSIAAGLRACALVSTLNSEYRREQGQSLKGSFYSALDRLTNGKVETYIAVTESIQTALCKAGVPAEKIEMIYSGIEISGVVDSLDRVAWRHRMGLPGDAIVCCAVGRLVWAKGYDDLVEAFGRVAKSLPGLYCLISGEGVLHEQLQQQIDREGLSDRVRLLGYQSHDDVMHLLRASDVFAMSSRSEGIPYAILEAGAMGLPIAATRCGGISEAVRDQVEALLVDPGDTVGLSAALEQLCNDRSLALRLSVAARERIRSEFSVENMIARTKAAYLKAVARS